VGQALRNEPITVYGDGRQTRSFCYVDDMVEALTSLMGSSSEITGPINLGNPEELPVLDVARRVIELTGASSPIRFQPLPEDDPRRRRPVIDRARSLLRWQPRVPLETGLKRTIADFRSRLAPAAAIRVPSLVARSLGPEPQRRNAALRRAF
jgi:UDP-glucuronate decarboxylase